MPLLCTLLLTGLLHPRAVYAHTTATHLYIPHIARRSSTVIQTAFVRSPASPFRTQAVNRFSHSRLITTIPRMAAPADDGFTGRPWKGGEAHEVLPKVFLGSMEAALDKDSLQEHGVTHILTVNGKDPKFKDDFEYKVINFGGDNGGITPHLEDSLKFVEGGKDAGGVMIHCTHGTGRSASMAIAAVMRARGEGKPGGVGSFTEAFQLVKARRPGTDPPMPFQHELATWEESQSS